MLSRRRAEPVERKSRANVYERFVAPFAPRILLCTVNIFRMDEHNSTNTLFRTMFGELIPQQQQMPGAKGHNTTTTTTTTFLRRRSRGKRLVFTSRVVCTRRCGRNEGAGKIGEDCSWRRYGVTENHLGGRWVGKDTIIIISANPNAHQQR